VSVKDIPSSNPSGSKHGPNVTAANRKTSPVVRTAPSSNPERNPLTIAISQAPRTKKENLTEDQIIEAARKFYKIYGSLPTQHSKEEVPGMPDTTWSGINWAARKKGRSLSQILQPLRKKLGIVYAQDKEDLTEDKIIEASRKFYDIHGRLPTRVSKEEVPGMLHVTWSGIDRAARKKGRTLSEILKPLKKELYGLTEKKIIEAARKFYKKYHRLPTKHSKEDVPGMPHTTWIAINQAGQHGKNGLDKGRTLSEILEPLKKELFGLTEK